MKSIVKVVILLSLLSVTFPPALAQESEQLIIVQKTNAGWRSDPAQIANVAEMTQLAKELGSIRISIMFDPAWLEFDGSIAHDNTPFAISERSRIRQEITAALTGIIKPGIASYPDFQNQFGTSVILNVSDKGVRRVVNHRRVIHIMWSTPKSYKPTAD